MTTEDQQLNAAREAIRLVILNTTVPAGAMLVALREAEARLMPAVRAQRDAEAANVARLSAALGDPPAKPRAKREAKAKADDSTDVANGHDEHVLIGLAKIRGIGDEAATVAQIAGATGITEHYVRQALERLVPGKVTREKAATGRGWRYSLAKSEAAQ